MREETRRKDEVFRLLISLCKALGSESRFGPVTGRIYGLESYAGRLDAKEKE